MTVCQKFDRTAQLKAHAELFDTMAQTVGLDLQEEAIAGRLQFDEISEAILRCCKCGGVPACKKWLASEAAHSSEGGEAPDFCRNRDLLSFLCEQTDAQTD
ncbi:DUF6455 family protein [Phaeobacter sp.]|uniref:DUF6455 family protein n=1 Tax=Phaeobacter sp. TaxID=1902409 RepID=UPI0025D1D591|nr:DUF6455 family protein [Phaeobacter sp.]